MTILNIVQLLGIFALIATLLAMLRQIYLQNLLLKAQLLKDRFEIYRRTCEPVEKEQISEFKLYPRDHMDISMYETRYQGNDNAIRRYIYMSQLYEFLSFTYALKMMRVPDPIGYHFVESWTKELISSPEFMDVHNQYRGYYPQFEAFVEHLWLSGVEGRPIARQQGERDISRHPK